MRMSSIANMTSADEPGSCHCAGAVAPLLLGSCSGAVTMFLLCSVH